MDDSFEDIENYADAVKVYDQVISQYPEYHSKTVK